MPETIQSVESFEPMMTNLRSGQEMLYKINQKGTKTENVELRILCTALHVID